MAEPCAVGAEVEAVVPLEAVVALEAVAAQEVPKNGSRIRSCSSVGADSTLASPGPWLAAAVSAAALPIDAPSTVAELSPVGGSEEAAWSAKAPQRSTPCCARSLRVSGGVLAKTSW